LLPSEDAIEVCTGVVVVGTQIERLKKVLQRLPSSSLLSQVEGEIVVHFRGVGVDFKYVTAAVCSGCTVARVKQTTGRPPDETARSENIAFPIGQSCRIVRFSTIQTLSSKMNGPLQLL
jgi:hypothetical protein